MMFNSSFLAAAWSRSGFVPSGGVAPVKSGPIAEWSTSSIHLVCLFGYLSSEVLNEWLKQLEHK